MSTKNRGVGCAIVVFAAVSLAACGNQSANTATPSTTPQSSAAASAASELSNLKITSWGPESTKAGVVFNKQPNGRAALWFRVNESLAGDEAAIEFNGVLLQGVIAGNDFVAAQVPADLYAEPGTYRVHVVAHKGEHTVQSNDVTFTVE